jgi:hypothetical protein
MPLDGIAADHRDGAGMNIELGMHSSDYWRQRAEEARVRGDDMRDFNAKATMLKIASMYDQMALRAAEREATQH